LNEEGSVMVAQGGVAGSSAVGKWSKAFGELHRRIGHRFCRSEARERVRRYLLGLLGRVERKNGWQMAEAIGEHDPQGVQRLLNSARWDADEVRDDLREYVLEHLAEEASGVLIVDETGFLKKGEKSVGVARQYTGTAGDTVNCQVGVFLAYSSEKGAAFLDRALYLPRAWTNAPARRAQAGVPEELVFRNKVELAEVMLERAFEADVAARWVLADSFYGRSHAFRAWLEARGKPYAVMVPKTNAVPLGGRKKKIERYVERLPKDAFSEVRPARDTGGRRPWEWACMDLAADPKKGMRRWLLVRRSTDDPEDLAFYQAYGPEATTVKELVKVCQERWAVEECFAEAKGEVGLDHYEVRKWDAWHRHVTLCLLAHAFLAVVRSSVEQEEGSGKRGILISACSPRRCRRCVAWCSRWPRRRDEDASCWGGLCGDGLTSRWRLAAARQAGRGGATPGNRPTGRRPSRPQRSRPRRRSSLTSNGHWCVPCCQRRGAGQADLPTTIAGCSAASCGWRGPDRRGGRCPRSTASGRVHTGATSCGSSKAYGSASSEC
jgi:SRSO17 transposase